ncbi:hypothetical protein KP004_12865 [Geomonas oryzisoli]|uniref:Uncharacterized protein n=1 Tax=Geomonas oryzisoli TaxID=2847992 RepID=A0ABX8J4S0_9BACT|nr:hypothetical protein [Geomonas oryzisoli]QWV92111.1 hypothetical protein KP004_12865 [Geomonas oryzisoli]
MGFRIIRNYRNLPPTKFHTFVQRVAAALGDKTRFPDSFWEGRLALLQAFFAAVVKHDAVHNETMMGNRMLLVERDLLQAQLVIYLDQIVLYLEMVAVLRPDVYSVSGFDLCKDRRGHGRGKAVNAALGAGQSEPGEGEGGSSS